MATATKKASTNEHLPTKISESKFSKAFQFSPDITKVSETLDDKSSSFRQTTSSSNTINNLNYCYCRLDGNIGLHLLVQATCGFKHRIDCGHVASYWSLRHDWLHSHYFYRVESLCV